MKGYLSLKRHYKENVEVLGKNGFLGPLEIKNKLTFLTQKYSLTLIYAPPRFLTKFKSEVERRKEWKKVKT